MNKRQHFFYTFMALLSLLLALAMIIHPQATFNGANNGLKTWALILIPSLLPFLLLLM